MTTKKLTMAQEADRMLRSPERLTRKIGRVLKAELETEALLARLAPEDRHALQRLALAGLELGQAPDDKLWDASLDFQRAKQRMARLILAGAGETV